MTVKRISYLALFTAAALIIHTAEALIPMPIPVPGVKPGLANTVTLFMLFLHSSDNYTAAAGSSGNNRCGQKPGIIQAADAIAVLLCRILLGAFIAGRPSMLLYSLSGGLLAVAAQLVVKQFVTVRQIWVCGAAGAVFHNVGQIAAALVITGTPGIIVYLPVLITAGIFTGTLTGLTAGFAVKRLKKYIYY